MNCGVGNGEKKEEGVEEEVEEEDGRRRMSQTRGNWRGGQQGDEMVGCKWRAVGWHIQRTFLPCDAMEGLEGHFPPHFYCVSRVYRGVNLRCGLCRCH